MTQQVKETFLEFMDRMEEDAWIESMREDIPDLPFDVVFRTIQGSDAYTIVTRENGLFTRYEDALARAQIFAENRSRYYAMGDAIWIWDEATRRDVGCYLDGKAI